MIFYKLCDHPLIKKVTSNLYVPPQLFFQLSSHSLALGVGTIRLHIKCGLTADLAIKFKVHFVMPSSSPPYEMASDRTPNGAFRAKRVPRKETRLQKPSRNIAAIDFGTKNCSLAYITENDRLELTQGVPKLPLNGTYLRVPTVILLNHDGQVEAFGHDARTLYGNLEDFEREYYFYFEEIKMNLRRDQVSEIQDL